MASREEQILEFLKTALEAIDGSGSYHYQVPKARIQYWTVTRAGEEVSGNRFGPRPSIVIESRTSSAPGSETVGEWSETITVLIGMYLTGTVDEIARVRAGEDLRRAIFSDWNAGSELQALASGQPSWIRYPYDPDREDLPIDGVHLELTLPFEETIGAPG